MPDFPWDRIAAAGDMARKHPDGIVDLSIGTPVDDTPEVITTALANAANAPGYPTAAGLLELRQAWVAWAKRVLSAELTVDQVVPSIGSKEIVAWLPIVFGLPCLSAGFAVFVALLQGFALLAGFCLAFCLLAVFYGGFAACMYLKPCFKAVKRAFKPLFGVLATYGASQCIVRL